MQKVRPKRTEEEPVGSSTHQDNHGHDISNRGSSDVDLRRDYRVELPDPMPMSHRKISSMSLGSVQERPAVDLPGTTSSSAGELDSSDRDANGDGRLFYSSSEKDKSLDLRLDSSSDGTIAVTVPVPNPQGAPASASSTSPAQPQFDPSLLGDEVAIRSYAGLSANTQERIRRFEQETRAMLKRDVNRHRRESKKWEVDRKRLEEEWYRAKCDLESDDILDQLADNPSGELVGAGRIVTINYLGLFICSKFSLN